MTTSRLNQRRRKREAETKKFERRRMRRAQGDWKFSGYFAHPNEQRDTWHQSKKAR